MVMLWHGWAVAKVTKIVLAYGLMDDFFSRRMYDDDGLGGRISLFLIDRFFAQIYSFLSRSASGHEIYTGEF